MASGLVGRFPEAAGNAWGGAGSWTQELPAGGPLPVLQGLQGTTDEEAPRVSLSVCEPQGFKKRERFFLLLQLAVLGADSLPTRPLTAQPALLCLWTRGWPHSPRSI